MGLLDNFDSPEMAMAMGLLAAGGPSASPVSFGQALNSGYGQYQNAMKMQGQRKMLDAQMAEHQSLADQRKQKFATEQRQGQYLQEMISSIQDPAEQKFAQAFPELWIKSKEDEKKRAGTMAEIKAYMEASQGYRPNVLTGAEPIANGAAGVPGLAGDPQALVNKYASDPNIPPADKQAIIAQINEQARALGPQTSGLTPGMFSTNPIIRTAETYRQTAIDKKDAAAELARNAEDRRRSNEELRRDLANQSMDLRRDIYSSDQERRNIENKNKRTPEYMAGLKEISKDESKAESASAVEQAYRRWIELQPSVQTGPITGRRPMSFDRNYQELQQLENFLTMNNFKPGQGAISNIERQFMKGSNPKVTNNQETNEDIAKIGIGAMQNTKDKANFKEFWLETHGKLMGADRAWQEYLDKNPRYLPKKNGRVKENTERTEWMDYFAGSGQGIQKESPSGMPTKPPASKRIDTLPPAKDHKGAEIREIETGKLLVSDGMIWKPKEPKE